MISLDRPSIISIAGALRVSLEANPEWDASGDCLSSSCRLVEALAAVGYPAHLAVGSFLLDYPDPQTYEGIDPSVVEVTRPLHYWAEIGDQILDITADQFADEVEDALPAVSFLPAAAARRYTRTGLDPTIEFYETGAWHCPSH